MSKLFLKLWYTFLFNEVFMPKVLCERESCTWFLPRLCGATGYLGARVRGTSFPQQFTCPYKEWYKRSFCYWLTAVGRCSLDRRQRSEKLDFIWAFRPHAVQCAFPKLPHWKGLIAVFFWRAAFHPSSLGFSCCPALSLSRFSVRVAL